MTMTRERALIPYIGIVRCIGLAAVVALNLISGRVFADTEKPTDAVLIVESGAFEAPENMTAALKKSGVIVRHVFWPRVVLAHVPQESEASARLLPGVVDLYRQRFEPKNAIGLSRTEQAGIVAWNMHFAASRTTVSGDVPPSAGYLPRRAAALPAPLPASPASPVPMGGSSAPYGADFYDTSEYMIGTVAVGVVFIESDGTIDPSTENWTQAEEDLVFSLVVQGYDEWAATSPFELSFFYQSEDSVLTGYEPINRSAGDQQLWLPQIMSALGYSGGSIFQTTREYLNDLRDALDTDWAILTLQSDATNDADGLTLDGYGGYSYTGGPFNWVAYDDDQLAIPHDDFCAQLLGYNFYTHPEAEAAGVLCWARTGYLNSENQNSEYPPGPAI